MWEDFALIRLIYHEVVFPSCERPGTEDAAAANFVRDGQPPPFEAEPNSVEKSGVPPITLDQLATSIMHIFELYGKAVPLLCFGVRTEIEKMGTLPSEVLLPLPTIAVVARPVLIGRESGTTLTRTQQLTTWYRCQLPLQRQVVHQKDVPGILYSQR